MDTLTEINKDILHLAIKKLYLKLPLSRLTASLRLNAHDGFRGHFVSLVLIGRRKTSTTK